MGGNLSSSKGSEQAESESASEMALSKAKEVVSNTPVVVFSKTYCPYCTRVKQLLTQLGANYRVIELNVESKIQGLEEHIFLVGDGSDIQAALARWTGQRTVPNVFIGGNHIGGCDTVTGVHRGGKLVPMLTQAGALAGGAAA